MLSSGLDVDAGDVEEPTNKVDAPQVGPIEALEEELMEREGFPFTRGNNGSTSRRHRYERAKPLHPCRVIMKIDGQSISDTQPTIDTHRWNEIINKCYEQYCSPSSRREAYEKCRVDKSSLKR
ncbi:hypothetical protein MJO28_004157, partial [Puccinia striiformis f. sp. tritici]